MCQALYRHKCFYLAKTGEEVDRIHSEALRKKTSSKKAHILFSKWTIFKIDFLMKKIQFT